MGGGRLVDELFDVFDLDSPEDRDYEADDEGALV